MAPTESPDDEPVSVESEAGNVGEGYVVELRILDKEGQPRKDVEVKLGDTTERTDNEGVASFIGVTPGAYKVEIDGKKRDVNVVAGDKTQVQRIDVKPVEASRLVDALIMYGIPVLALVVVLALALLFQKKRPIFKIGKTGIAPTTTGDNDFMKDAKKSAMEIVAPADIQVPKPSEVFEPTEKSAGSSNKK